MKRSLFYILLAFFTIAAFLYAIYNTERINDSLRNNHSVSCAAISRVWVSKSNYYISYEFNAGEQSILVETSCTSETRRDFLNGRNKMLVVYRKDNPQVNHLLNTNSDMGTFNIVSSDTSGIICN